MKSHDALLAAVQRADAEVRSLEAETPNLSDETRATHIGLAEKTRRLAVMEAVLRRPTPVSWSEIADTLHLSVDDVRRRYIR